MSSGCHDAVRCDPSDVPAMPAAVCVIGNVRNAECAMNDEALLDWLAPSSSDPRVRPGAFPWGEGTSKAHLALRLADQVLEDIRDGSL